MLRKINIIKTIPSKSTKIIVPEFITCRHSDTLDSLPLDQAYLVTQLRREGRDNIRQRSKFMYEIIESYFLPKYYPFTVVPVIFPWSSLVLSLRTHTAEAFAYVATKKIMSPHRLFWCHISTLAKALTVWVCNLGTKLFKGKKTGTTVWQYPHIN